MDRLDVLFGSMDLARIMAEDEAAIRRFQYGLVDEIILPHSGIKLTWDKPAKSPSWLKRLLHLATEGW